MKNNSTSTRRRSSSNENRRAPYQDSGSYSPRYPARYEEENEWDEQQRYEGYGQDRQDWQGWDEEENDGYRSRGYSDFDEDGDYRDRSSRGVRGYDEEESERYSRQRNMNANRPYGRTNNGPQRSMNDRGDVWSPERGYSSQERQRDYRSNTGSSQRSGYGQGEYRQGNQGYYRTGRSSGY